MHMGVVHARRFNPVVAGTLSTFLQAKAVEVIARSLLRAANVAERDVERAALGVGAVVAQAVVVAGSSPLSYAPIAASPGKGCSKRQDQEQRDAGSCKSATLPTSWRVMVIDGFAEQVVKRRRNQT